MTAQISAYGRLVADPQTRTTTNGNNMAMARLAVSLPVMRQRRESQPSGWALLLLGSRPMRWQSTRKATL
jgi:single-stranded DNA-binding protein